MSICVPFQYKQTSSLRFSGAKQCRLYRSHIPLPHWLHYPNLSGGFGSSTAAARRTNIGKLEQCTRTLLFGFTEKDKYCFHKRIWIPPPAKPRAGETYRLCLHNNFGCLSPSRLPFFSPELHWLQLRWMMVSGMDYKGVRMKTPVIDHFCCVWLSFNINMWSFDLGLQKVRH